MRKCWQTCIQNSSVSLTYLPLFPYTTGSGLPAALNIAARGSRLIKQEINEFWMKSSQLGAACASLRPVLLIRLKTSTTSGTKLLKPGGPRLPPP